MHFIFVIDSFNSFDVIIKLIVSLWMEQAYKIDYIYICSQQCPVATENER